MEKNKKLIITDNTVYTVGYLRSVSRFTLQSAKKDKHGSILNCTASVIFSAFTLEAYFNYLGEIIIPTWSDCEKLRPLEKLADKIRIHLDYSRPPFQSCKIIFKIRNSLAHGKTETLTKKDIQIISDDFTPDLPQTKWQKLITIKNAERFLLDTQAMIEFLHDASGVSFNPLFVPEIGGWFIIPVNENDELR